MLAGTLARTGDPRRFAFAPVLTGTLPRDAFDHWFSFMPVEARYVKLVLLTKDP